MVFPTIPSEVLGKVHAIKDKHSAECGYQYRDFFESKKMVLKQIQFKKIGEITCEECQRLIHSKKF